MSSKEIPQPLPGPTPMDASESLVNSAINFAFNPRDSNDADMIRRYSSQVETMFKQNYFKPDPKQIAIATVSAYLKAKTKSGGGTRKRKSKKTRKSRRV